MTLEHGVGPFVGQLRGEHEYLTLLLHVLHFHAARLLAHDVGGERLHAVRRRRRGCGLLLLLTVGLLARQLVQSLLCLERRHQGTGAAATATILGPAVLCAAVQQQGRRLFALRSQRPRIRRADDTGGPVLGQSAAARATARRIFILAFYSRLFTYLNTLITHSSTN